MSKEKRRVPKLRFPGFTEDWEQRKLGEIFEYLQNNTLSRDSLNYKNPNIKNIHYGDILVKFDEILDGSNKDIPYINSELDLSKFSKSLLRDGDIVFSDTAEDDAVGKAIELQNVSVPFILSGLHTIPCRPLIPFGKGYLGNFLNSDSYRMQLRPLVQGIKVSSISKSALKDTMIVYPKKLDEQEKIGGLFYHISKMITLHQRKLDNLKLKKKALLQKLFPKNGERYPELRFPGFTDAWEQRKFSDITYLSGIKNKENKPYESYSISNEFGFIPQDEQFENGGTMKTADKSMYYIVSQNSFAYNPARINVGSIGYYNKPDNVIVSSLYEVFKTTDIVSDKFLWHWFKSNQFNRLIEKYQEGGVRLYFYYDKLCKGTIDLPTINEQNKISNLLDDLDMYITLHQRKLDHLKLQKKALLQQMFV